MMKNDDSFEWKGLSFDNSTEVTLSQTQSSPDLPSE